MYATVTVKWKITSYVDRHEWHEGMCHMWVVGTLVITVVWLTTSQDGTTIPRVVSCVNKIKKDGRGLGTRLVFYQLVCVCAVLGRNFYCVFHLYVYTTLVSYPARLFVVCFLFLLMNTLGMRLVPHLQIDMKKYTTASWCPHWNRKSLHRERACDIINKVGNSVYSAYFHIFFRHLENQWIGQL